MTKYIDTNKEREWSVALDGHTPGPWRVEQGTTLVWGNCNPDDHSTRGMGYPIADARINPSGNWSTGPYADEGEANAHLIAAAPDLKAKYASALDTIDTLRAENERLREALRGLLVETSPYLEDLHIEAVFNSHAVLEGEA